jgi:hypothetical protein
MTAYRITAALCSFFLCCQGNPPATKSQ